MTNKEKIHFLEKEMGILLNTLRRLHMCSSEVYWKNKSSSNPEWAKLRNSLDEAEGVISHTRQHSR